MTTLEILQKAIELRKPIRFEYAKEGKVQGTRVGNVHAVFLHGTTDNIMSHIFQTDGASDTKEKLPGFRQPLLEHIVNIEILMDEPCFEIAQGYNPVSNVYTRVISKI